MKPFPQKPQPSVLEPQRALDAILQGKIGPTMLQSHEEKPKTYKEAKDSLWNIVETIRDQARNAGFQYLIKPKWIEEREKGSR